jgi:hypothetical protein
MGGECGTQGEINYVYKILVGKPFEKETMWDT